MTHQSVGLHGVVSPARVHRLHIGQRGPPRPGLGRRFRETIRWSWHRNTLIQIELQESDEEQALANLISGLLIRQIIKDLQDEDFEP